MRASNLFKQYRKGINPPYVRRDIFAIFVTIVALVSLPVLIYSTIFYAEEFKPNLSISADNNLQVPVLVLSYFPTTDGVNLDTSITGYGSSIVNVRNKVAQININLSNALESGSTYHGYNDPGATPALDYSIYEAKEFLEPIPQQSEIPKHADNYKIFSDPTIGVADICDYVDNAGVKEVWIWMYHTANTTPIESNMAMGNISSQYWNFASYGDVSNSAQRDDVPVCNKSYTVYDYNYSRSAAEAMENHGHQIERMMGFIDGGLFFTKFVGPLFSQTGDRHCGNAHNPPNAQFEYNRNNLNFVDTDCQDWNPDLDGQISSINCQTWGCTTVGWMTWWMQNMPGKDNPLTYNGGPMRNWWEFIGDFDAALTLGKTFTLNISSPTVSITFPINNQNVSGTINIQADAQDDVGIDRVEFYIDGQLVGSDASLPYSYSWDTNIVSNGPHMILAKAFDVSGNVGTSISLATSVSNGSSGNPADINNDGNVDVTDLSILLSNWNTSDTTADINNDGEVNIFDLSILLSNWTG